MPPKTHDAVAENKSADAPQQVTLDEFCMRKSVSDKRVELLGAFHHVETKAGHMNDTETAYAQRYEAFVNKPV